MSRVKLTEYRAKKLLLGDAYRGISLVSDQVTVPEGVWVAKVDQGVKKRMKQGLVRVKVGASEIAPALAEWRGKGFSRFIVEPFLPHEPAEEVTTMLIAAKEEANTVATAIGIPEEFLRTLVEAFDSHYFAFLEINPLVIKDGVPYLLDAAVLIDSAGEFFARGAWDEEDIVEGKKKHATEERVAALQKTTPASLKLSVLNEDGSLFFLLSGGGGSIVIADEAALLGFGSEIGNYGEYSGGPTREETYLYAKEVLGLLLASKAKKKALVIAGGVANFTDVAKTFAGIRDAIAEVSSDLQKAGVKVFVRRGGPNEAKGLGDMKIFLEQHGFLGSMHGSSAVITSAVDDAIAFIRS